MWSLARRAALRAQRWPRPCVAAALALAVLAVLARRFLAARKRTGAEGGPPPSTRCAGCGGPARRGVPRQQRRAGPHRLHHAAHTGGQHGG